MSEVAFLIRRAAADYEMAIEAALSGMNTVVFDAMRDVMEIEYLQIDLLPRSGANEPLAERRSASPLDLTKEAS